MPNIKFLQNIVNDSYSDDWIINKFIVFKSVNDILFLIYINVEKSIISYDLINNQRINEIKKAHNTHISSFRYFLDIINKRDLILSVSSDDHNVKIWDINNFICVCDIWLKYRLYSYLKSASFLTDNNQIFITTSQSSKDKNSEPIKVFDLKGKEIKKINNSNENILFVDYYYDNKLSKTFIIACCQNCSKVYDYNKNELFCEYSDGGRPCNIVIKKKEEITELIESSYDGKIRIWNFHSGLLIKRINISNRYLREICIWDNEYLFIGCDDKTIKLVNYNTGKIIKQFYGHNDRVISIKKIEHPQYGKCLLSQSEKVGPIKLWIIET